MNLDDEIWMNVKFDLVVVIVCVYLDFNNFLLVVGWKCNK